MKKLTVLIVIIMVLFACGTVAYAESAQASPTSISSASWSGEVLSAPSGSVIPQQVQPPSGTQNAQIAQYVIYSIAIAVVVILLVVFRRRFKRNKDGDE